jgi:hypothetical protein
MGLVSKMINQGLGLWCLTPSLTIFLSYHGCQFYWNTPTCRKLLTNFITSGTETAYPEFTPGA